MSNKFEIQQDEILGNIYDNKLFKRLVVYLKPYMKYVIIAFILLLMNTAGELILPLLTMRAVDDHIVPDKKLIRLDDQMYDRFVQNADTDKFTIYSANQEFWILVTSRNQGYIQRDFLSELREKELFIDEKIVIFDRNEVSDDLMQKIGDKHEMIDENHFYMLLSDIYKLPVPDILELRNKSISTVTIIGLIFLVIVLIRFGIGYFQTVLTTIASQKAMHDLRSDLFAHLEKMPVTFFDKNPVGRLVTRVTSDIRAIDEMLTSGVITIIQDLFIIVAIMILMVNLNWRLALVSFIVIPFVVVLISEFRKRTRITYREIRKYVAQVNATIAEHISGVKIIQLFNQYVYKTKEFNETNTLHYKASMKQLKIFAVFRPIIGASRQIATAIILWYAGGQILENMLTLGLFMAFISYMEKLYEPINNFTEKFNILQSAMAGAERIFDLMEQSPADYRDDLTDVEKINGEIEFKNVWLSYSDKTVEDADKNNSYVLKNISFKVKPGEKVALVGHTGSGKTSIVNLVMNMYQNQKGNVKIDDKDINEYRLQDLRKHIGMVQQDVFLFSGNIRDNIVLNNKNITDDEVNKITDHVNVSNFINSLPGKLDEEVQERGATFSVGQRQLIAFARVLAYDPAIFILDEATSNIDTETEMLIQDALFKIMQNRTSIIIAHRLSTIQHVDRILVLHKGEIVEQGSHQELLRKEGLYYDLYRLQYS
jgi:ATP-binding cassette subfamily B protein/subfamily B ATP-binding cassette protein MsbA